MTTPGMEQGGNPDQLSDFLMHWDYHVKRGERLAKQAGHFATQILVMKASGEEVPDSNLLPELANAVPENFHILKQSIRAIAYSANVSPYSQFGERSATSTNSTGSGILNAQFIKPVKTPDDTSICYPVLIQDDYTLAWDFNGQHRFYRRRTGSRSSTPVKYFNNLLRFRGALPSWSQLIGPVDYETSSYHNELNKTRQALAVIIRNGNFLLTSESSGPPEIDAHAIFVDGRWLTF